MSTLMIRCFFFSSRGRHTRWPRDWSSDVCSSDLSVFGEDVTVDWSIISDDKELDVRGAHLGPHTWSAAIKIIESGVLPLDEICTHQYGLGDVQTALDQVADSAGSSVKVSLIPGDR